MNKQRDEELKKSKVKAKIFTRVALSALERVHRIQAQPSVCVECETPDVWSAELSDAACTSRPTATRDLTPGDHDVPPFNLGGQDMYAISPDGQELAYTSNIDEVEATSTNNEIFIVPMAGGTPKKISTSPGSDTTPLYSPDGKYIAWRSRRAPVSKPTNGGCFVTRSTIGKTRDANREF